MRTPNRFANLIVANLDAPTCAALTIDELRRVLAVLGAIYVRRDSKWQVEHDGSADYFTRRTVQGRGPVSWWHNLECRPQDVGYTEDLITSHVLEFIRENKERPFLCYVPFHIVHAPLQAKDSDLDGVDAKVTDETKRVYAAMVKAMDKNVATILAELDQLGLRDNTIVVFTSGNGATKDGSNLPFRGGKHTIFEGGTRLTIVIHWPNGKLAGGDGMMVITARPMNVRPVAVRMIALP